MLLLTDRPDVALRLKALMEAVEPCTIVSAGGAADQSGRHSIILSDLALDTEASVALARATLARCPVSAGIPVLHLSRQDDDVAFAQAQAINATAVVSRKASAAQIVFTAKRLIEAARGKRGKLAASDQRRVRASIDQAGAALAEVMAAARRGDNLRPDSVERGSSAIIAAVAGHDINVWLDMVRGHDDVTYQHCLLVMGIAATFSARLGMTVKSQRQIVTSALLHDIGKAQIPVEILNKKGRLSPDEMEVMRTHPGIGHAMLVRQGGFDANVLDIVRHHHEYLDGSGYPDGLRAAEISPLVRLMTICDIYAALIERRPYKAPRASPDALAVLAEMGTKLDAGLTATFHAAVSER